MIGQLIVKLSKSNFMKICSAVLDMVHVYRRTDGLTKQFYKRRSTWIRHIAQNICITHNIELIKIYGVHYKYFPVC